MSIFASVTQLHVAPFCALCGSVLTLIGILFCLYSKRNPFHGLLSIITYQLNHCYRSSSLFHALGRLIIDRKCPKGLPNLDPVENVSKNVWRILGMNPGSHTLQGTNTWLVGNGPSKILIDTGEDITSEKYVKFLLQTVFPLTKTTNISIILLTHGHGDHLGGVQTLLNELKKLGKPLPKIFKRQIPNGKFPSGNYPCENILQNQIFNASENSTEKINLIAIYTPGHTDDHVSFTLQEEDSSSLFSGDCVLGCGTTVFDDLHEYMNSLMVLRELMIQSKSRNSNQIITTIYPGHGPVIRGTSLHKIDEYISHRSQREQQILEILSQKYLMKKFEDQNNGNENSEKSVKTKNKKSGTAEKIRTNKLFSDSDYLSSWEIMSKVYGNLPVFVKISAQWNVSHHLEKLKKDGKVEYCWPDLWKMKA